MEDLGEEEEKVDVRAFLVRVGATRGVEEVCEFGGLVGKVTLFIHLVRRSHY